MKPAATDRGLHVLLETAGRAQPLAGNLASSLGFLRGADLEYYAPLDVDLQKPHTRDEIYVIAVGSGTFEAAGETFSFSAGDVLYVPAHVEHRFTKFTEGFGTWVIFYGPEY